ncbi:DUF3426 domain-containing protein [Lysobacter xanthus]
MFKPCPNCGFLVALIAGREASQRCPRCGSALVGENDDIPEPTPRRRQRDVADETRLAMAHEAPVAREPVDPPSAPVDAPSADTPAGAPDAPSEAIPVDSPAPEDTTAAVAPPVHDGPSFVRRRERARPDVRRWPWIVALGALALLLAVQLLLAQRAQLARDPTWRPVVSQACAVFGCDVPAWHEPSAYAMLARGVRPDRAQRRVLHVTATVRNDARWPQPPPVVVISLSDVDGRRVGARAVPPAEYGRDAASQVAPGETLDVAFDVREPAAPVESFDFQLQ